jgi:hypothetical protein
MEKKDGEMISRQHDLYWAPERGVESASIWHAEADSWHAATFGLRDNNLFQTLPILTFH